MLSEDDIKNRFDLSDDDFNKLFELVKAQIAQKIGIPLEPTKFTQVERNFFDDIIILDYFPLDKIHHIKIGEEDLTTDDCIIDYSGGIIYLNNSIRGFLKLEYTSCISTNDYSMYILPLINDMIEYQLDTGWDKDASSIKEGEITITYDTSIGKGAKINDALNELKERYSAFCRMI